MTPMPAPVAEKKQMDNYNPIKAELQREIGKTLRTLITWSAIVVAVYIVTNFLDARFPAPTTREISQ